MIHSGDTAFVLLCAALVCLMTPGLAFFYCGFIRKKNVLTIMMQNFISMGVVTLVWFIALTNAFNLIDGLDGLATGLALVAGIGLMALAASAGAILTIVVIGLVNALVWYGRLHFRLLKPAIEPQS